MKKLLSVVLTLGILCSSAPALFSASAAADFSYTAYADTYLPDTGIAMAPDVVFDVTCADDLTALSADKTPAVALFHVDGKGNAVDEKGEKIAELDDAVRACANKIIPAFYFSTSEEMNATLTYVTKKNLLDAMVFSNNAQLVKAFKASRGNVQGGVWFKDVDLSDADTIQTICRSVNSASAMIAVVEGNVTKDGVEQIQLSGLTCWSVVKATQYDIYNALYTGINGMAVKNFTMPIEIMESIQEPTMIRKTFLSGHRGELSYPENTIEGAKAAYYYGADYIELDLMRTKDNRLINMHDTSLNRTCNYTGSKLVADMTLDEIREYKVGGQYQVPVLEDYFEFINQRSDMRLLVELKTSDEAVPALLEALIKEYNVQDKIIVISGFNARLSEFKELMPEISTNNLNSYKTIESLCYYAYTMNSSFGPGITYLDSTDVMTQAIVRGIPVYSWTFSTAVTFEEYMYINTSLTSNYSKFATEQYLYLDADTQSEYTSGENVESDVNFSLTIRARQKSAYSDRKTLECAPQLVSAASLDCTNAPLTVNATYANGKLTTGTATGYGIFWFADKWQSTASENYYYVLSRPFKVTSGDLSFEAYETEYTQAQYLEDSQKTNQTPSDSATSETTSGSTSTSASSSTSTSTSSSSHKTSTSSGCGNVTGGVAGVGAVAALFALGKRKKNRK